MDDPVLPRLLLLVEEVAGAHRLPDELGLHTVLTEGGLDLDSPAILELLLSCEIEFGITFDSRIDLTPDALRTIGSLAGSVRRACAARILGVEQIRGNPEAEDRGPGTAATAPKLSQ